MWNVDELTKCAATYTFGDQKKRVRDEERERQRQRQEGLNLTEMNEGSLRLRLILSPTRPLEYKDGERKRRHFFINNILFLSSAEK